MSAGPSGPPLPGRGACPEPLCIEPLAATTTAASTPATAAPKFPLSLGQIQATGRASASATTLLRPQLHLRQAQAATDQVAKNAGPAGLGLDSPAMRERMVQRLRAEGGYDERVLHALTQVCRHEFVDSALVGQAYEDTSLPIGLSQTISKPSVVARMLSLLMAGDGATKRGHLGRVLEIGTGCGYQAALLCVVSHHVLTVERLHGLFERANTHLQGWPADRLRTVHGDGRLGFVAAAPYDTIIAAAGGEALPDDWLAQLAVGGRLVAPMVDAGTGQQTLVVVDRRATGYARVSQENVHFVPLKSGTE
jgi:protein-L-isoaspartate(D-aspartate) O-methyltransferase